MRTSHYNQGGGFFNSPLRKPHNKIHPVNILNQSNQSADAGNLRFNMIGIRPPLSQSPSNHRGVPMISRQTAPPNNDFEFASGYIGDLNNNRGGAVGPNRHESQRNISVIDNLENAQ